MSPVETLFERTPSEELEPEMYSEPPSFMERMTATVSDAYDATAEFVGETVSDTIDAVGDLARTLKPLICTH